MKKLLATLGTGITFLTLTAPAYAAASLSPCEPENNNEQFAQLCELTADRTGEIIVLIVTVLLILVTIIALFFLIYSGLRWVWSGGDKGKVDEARKGLIAAIIGLVIAFLAFFILSLVLNFFGINVEEFELPSLLEGA